MSRCRMIALVASLATFTGADGLAAQDRTMEIGIDSGIQRQSYEGSSQTLLAMPTGWPTFRAPFRIGEFVSKRLELEPAFGFLATSSYAFFVGSWSMLYHYPDDPAATRPYVRVGALLRAISDGSSSTQFALEGALGVKVPARAGIGTRLEFGLGHAFENRSKRLEGLELLDITLGLSYFLQ